MATDFAEMVGPLVLCPILHVRGSSGRWSGDLHSTDPLRGVLSSHFRSAKFGNLGSPVVCVSILWCICVVTYV